MNKDIRLATNYFDHPKIRKLLKRLGAEGVLSHIRLLTFVGRVTPSGILEDMDNQDIAHAAGWYGDPDVFINTLLDLRLLDRGSPWYRIHNWEKWNHFAMTAEARSEQARRNANKRWEKKRKGKQKDNANRIANGNADGNAPPPSPPPSLEGDGGGGGVATPHVEDGGDPPWTVPDHDGLISIAEEIAEEFDCWDLIADVKELLAQGVSNQDIVFALTNFKLSYKSFKGADPGEYLRKLLSSRSKESNQ